MGFRSLKRCKHRYFQFETLLSLCPHLHNRKILTRSCIVCISAIARNNGTLLIARFSRMPCRHAEQRACVSLRSVEPNSGIFQRARSAHTNTGAQVNQFINIYLFFFISPKRNRGGPKRNSTWRKWVKRSLHSHRQRARARVCIVLSWKCFHSALTSASNPSIRRCVGFGLAIIITSSADRFQSAC